MYIKTKKNILLSQTFFSFKLLKYSFLLSRESVTHEFLSLVYLPLFSSVLASKLLKNALNIIALDKFLFIKDE